MPLFDTLSIEIAKQLWSLLRSDESIDRPRTHELAERLEYHMKEVLSWSERVQFYGMPSAETTESSTIELTLDTVPRKFRDPRRETEKLPEKTLISHPQHYVLLGDPGSGKTTTLKRLARAILLNESQAGGDQWQFPLVFRLREAPPGEPLFKLIADALGIAYTSKKVKIDKVIFGDDEKYHTVKVTVTTLTVGDLPLEELLAEMLDRCGALLLLDGLDEVPISQRMTLEETIEQFARKMRISKIIVSCRSGDYTRPLDGFEAVEICPLDFDQIETIAARWLPDRDDFFRRLRSLPFQDLVDKPLFLCQLIVFYRNTGYLPEQPSSVYRRIIRLSLEDWDAQRRVHRKSRYAGFDPDQKLDFLAALAYHLTYRIKTKRFSTAQLISAYTAVCASYSLPPAEASKVAKEIESHTGIILESGDSYFEFSHLSLQEYLCAYYLVREPFAGEIGTYLSEYPAPIAVAICLAANPSNWFSALVLNKSDWSHRGTAMSSLLSRLVIEKPQFAQSVYLGCALLKILFLYGKVVQDYIRELMKSSEVVASLSEALDCYLVDVSRSDESDYRLSLNPKASIELAFKIDIGGTIPAQLYTELAQRFGMPLVAVNVSAGAPLMVVEGKATRRPDLSL